MHRLALSTTSSFPTIPSIDETTVSSSDILHRNRVQRELHQAVRDSIVAERILDRQARKKYPLTQEEKEEQRLAKRQWEISNGTLKRIAEEQTTLVQLASHQKQVTELSEKKRLEMHPRLQQALAETVTPNHHQRGLVQQVFSENTPDLDEFIREQEDALKTVRRKLRRSYWHQPQRAQRASPPSQVSRAAVQALKTDKEKEPTSQDLVAFIRLQEQELQTIQNRHNNNNKTNNNNNNKARSKTPQRSNALASSGNTNNRKRHPVDPESQSSYNDYTVQQPIARGPSSSHQPPRAAAAAVESLESLQHSPTNSDIAIANIIRKEQLVGDETSLPPSLDAFIHEQRMALESFRKKQPPAAAAPPPPQLKREPSASHRRQPLSADSDDEKSLPPPLRHQRNPFEDSNQSRKKKKKKPPPPLPLPLPMTFQQRPVRSSFNKQATPPPFLVYAQAAKSAQQHHHRSSMSTMEAPSTYSYYKPPAAANANAKTTSTASFASKSIPSAPFLGDLKSREDTTVPRDSLKEEEQSLLSAMSDIISTVVEDERQVQEDQMDQDEEDTNVDIIRKSLGMNDHSCCLRHPNQVVCEYTSAYMFDRVQPCRVCSSERRAGSQSSSPDNSTDMARVIGDIQQLQADKRQWRNKTNIMFNGKTSYKSSTRSNIIVQEYDGAEDEVPLTDEQWKDLVRQRVLQVDGWEQNTSLKYNPLCERYFRMLQMGVPIGAVKTECENEGNDPRILDLDPERPLKEQLDAIYSNEPQTRHALLLKYHRGSPVEDLDANQVVQAVIKAFEAEYAKAMQRGKNPNSKRGLQQDATMVKVPASPSIDAGALRRLQELETAATLKAEDASRRRRAETDKRLKAEEELRRLQQLENEARLKAEDSSCRRRVEETTRLQAEDALRRIRQAEAAAKLELQKNSEEIRRLQEKCADSSLRRRAETDKRMKLEEELRQIQEKNKRHLEEAQAAVETKLEEARRLGAEDAERRIEEERRRRSEAEVAAKGMIDEQAQHLKQLEAARLEAEDRVRLLEEEKAAVEARLKSEGSVHSSSVRVRAMEKNKRNEAEDAARDMMNLQAKHLQDEAQARLEAEEKASDLAKRLELLETEREAAKVEVARLKATEQERIEAAGKALESAKLLESEKLIVAARLKAAEEEAARLKAKEHSLVETTRRKEEGAVSATKLKLETETRRLNARLKEEEQARRKAEAAMQEAEEESRRKSVAEFKAKSNANARLKEEEQARLKAQQEAARLRKEAKQAMDLVALAEAAEEILRLKVEAGAKAKAAAETRLKAEEEARIKAESETARLLDRIAEEEAARLKVEEESKNKKKRKSSKGGRKSKSDKSKTGKSNKPKTKKQKSLSVPSTSVDLPLPPLSPYLTDEADSQQTMEIESSSDVSDVEIIEEEFISDDEEFVSDDEEYIEEEIISDSDSDEEIIEEVMEDDDEEEAKRVAVDETAGVIHIDPPPLPSKYKKKLSDAEYRKQLIDTEFQSIIRETEDNELEEPFEPEAVEALRIAANNLAYRKKYYNSLDDKFVYFPSVTRLLVNYSLIEEAEKHYWDEEDEWPIEYSAALRAIACEKIGDDDGDNEDMEKFAADLDLHVPVVAAPSPRVSGFKLLEGPTDVSDDEMSTQRMPERSSSRRSMGLEDESDDELYAPNKLPERKKKMASWMYPLD